LKESGFVRREMLWLTKVETEEVVGAKNIMISDSAKEKHVVRMNHCSVSMSFAWCVYIIVHCLPFPVLGLKNGIFRIRFGLSVWQKG